MQGERYHNQDNLNSGVKNRRNYCTPLLYTAYQGTAFMFPSWWCSCSGASAWDGGGHRSSRLRHRRGRGCWTLGAEADTEVHPQFWSTTELCSLSQPFSLGFAEPTWKTSEPLGQKIRGRVLNIQETWCGGLAWELGHVFVSSSLSVRLETEKYCKNMAGNRHFTPNFMGGLPSSKFKVVFASLGYVGYQLLLVLSRHRHRP